MNHLLTSTEHSAEAERHLQAQDLARAQTHAALAVAAALRESTPQPRSGGADPIRPPRRIRLIALPLTSKPARIESLCASVVGTDAWALLCALAANPGALETADLQATAGIGTARFGGLLAGFAKTCACYSLESTDLIVRTEERDTEGRFHRRYDLAADARPVVEALLARLPDETHELAAAGPVRGASEL